MVYCNYISRENIPSSRTVRSGKIQKASITRIVSLEAEDNCISNSISRSGTGLHMLLLSRHILRLVLLYPGIPCMGNILFSCPSFRFVIIFASTQYRESEFLSCMWPCHIHIPPAPPPPPRHRKTAMIFPEL